MAAVMASCGSRQQAQGGAGALFVPDLNAAPRVSEAGATEKVIYSFAGGTDGEYPEAAPIWSSSKRVLYGTTGNGGKRGCSGVGGCGTVYEVDTSGREKILHAFTSGTDGEAPAASLVVLGGNLFGTTVFGGGYPCREGRARGCGTVFELTPSEERVPHPFLGGSQGALPQAPLTLINHEFFGETTGGGTGSCYYLNYPGCGLIFKISSATGKFTVLHTFNGSPNDGGNPQGGLVLLKEHFYGTTSNGGNTSSNCTYSYGCGTVFKMTPSGKETVLYSFQDGPGDGALPESGLAVLNGVLYGTTYSGGTYNCAISGSGYGCGTVFEITTSRKNQTIYNFRGGRDGQFPNGLIAVGSKLYGTTLAGGSSLGNGTVFEMTPSGQETILYRFKGKPDASGPSSGLIFVHGTFYGTTQGGGTHGAGALYAIYPQLRTE